MKSKPRLLSKRPEITPFFTWSAIVGFFLFVVALLVAAHSLGGIFSLDGITNGLIYVTSIVPIGNLPENKSQLILGLRGLAPVVATAGLILPWLLNLYRQYECRFFKRNHAIICGLGWQGRAYAYNSRECGDGTVAIELNVDMAARELCSKHNIFLVEGAADNESTLEQAGVMNARRVFICTGNQDLNLDIAHRIKQIVTDRGGSPLQVHISLGAGLSDATSTDEMYSDLLVSDANCQFSFYDPEARMARMFFYQYPVYRWAEEQTRPASDPVRVHLVFLGFNRLAGELILQYSRIWPCKDQHRPQFTIVVPDASRAKRFEARHRDVFRDITNGMRAIADIEIVQVEDNHVQLLNAALLDALPKPPVTAVISCDDDTEINLQRAGYCRKLCRKLDCWHVPILVHIDKREGADDLLELSRKQIDPADRILPFGSASDYCDLPILAYMEGWAKAIHSGYQRTAGTVDPDLPANKPWEQLSHYYHANNHRAADHVPVKLFSAGFQWSSTCPWPVFDPCKAEIEKLYKAKINSPECLVDGTANEAIDVDDESFDPFNFDGIYRISRFEHRSWLSEHRIKGFSIGAHDKVVRRTHPNIVDWGGLAPYDQVKDFSQTISIAYRLATEANFINAAMPIRVVVTGHSELTWSEAQMYVQAIGRLFSEESFLSEIANRWLELITPLASGTDCLLTQALLDNVYVSRNCSCLRHLVRGVSLIQPGTVPLNLIDTVSEESFKNKKMEERAFDNIWWPLESEKRSFDHYKFEMTKYRHRILQTVSSHKRVHLYADRESPLPWTEQQRRDLIDIEKMKVAKGEIADMILSPAEVIADGRKLAEQWMHKEADLLVYVSRDSFSDKHWWGSQKPAYVFNLEANHFERIGSGTDRDRKVINE